MIIDFYCRPPYGSFVTKGAEWDLFSPPILEKYTTLFSSDISQSASEVSFELFLQEMDDAQIEKVVLPVRTSAGGKNSEIQELLIKYPKRFIGLVGVNLHDGNAIHDIDKYILHGQSSGIIMEPSLDAIPWLINDSKAENIFSFCNTHSIPVVMTFGGLDSIAYEQILAIEEVAQKYPAIHFILCHAGWPHTVKMCQLATYYPNIFLCVDAYLFQVPGFNDYVNAAHTIAKDKIIFGSAYPLVSLEKAVEFTKKIITNKEVFEKVVKKNALLALKII